MIDAFNKATKKFTDFFTYIESEIEFNDKNIHDTLIKFTDNIYLWQYDSSYADNEYPSLFKALFNDHYTIYNTTPRKIAFKSNTDISKVIELKAPDCPSYTLNYIISFCISASDWLKASQTNILIIHNDLKDGKVLCLLSALLSFTSQSSVLHPMDSYANLTSTITNKTIAALVKNSESKNHIRYMNYFATVQTSPIINMKRIYLKSILINSAPAIDNSDNTVFSPYVTINKNSFYTPVIRITSNGSVVYCSYNKTKPVEKVFYSPENCIIFNVNALLYSDTVIEVLHKGDERFKQLFSIQFHSLFVSENAIRFNRDQIDGACKDIRYPEDFFIDLLFDQTKDVSLSQYDEESIKWKNKMKELIVKSYKVGEGKDKEKEAGGSNKGEEGMKEKDDKALSTLKAITNPSTSTGITTTTTTVHQVEEMLNKMDIGDESKKNIDKEKDIVIDYNDKGNTKEDKREDNDEDDDDEDVENYLKNLEDKTK